MLVTGDGWRAPLERKLTHMVLMKHLIYTLIALTWHHMEGKDGLPNLRSYVKEIMKEDRGVGEEGTHFRRKWSHSFLASPRICRPETLIWASLAIWAHSLWRGEAWHHFPLPGVVSHSPESCCRLAWVWPLERCHLAPPSPDVGNMSMSFNRGLPRWCLLT